MRAIIFEGSGPLRYADVDMPTPAHGEILIKVEACAVCRTDLHVIDGDLLRPKLPLIPGHEIIGTVVSHPSASCAHIPGTRVGVPWLGWTCGACEYCLNEAENLCPKAQFTGYTRDGGFAEYCVADARYCFPISGDVGPAEQAPLMCAGLIGFRSYRKAGNAARIGIYGFGAAAHIMAQVAKYEGRALYAFTKPNDHAGQSFARRLGCIWVGASDQQPPEYLDAAIIFAPAGELIPQALKLVRPGGCVICGGIHMSDIPSFPYDILWGERSVMSVANLTRADGHAFLELAQKIPVKTTIRCYPLAAASEALDDLRNGKLEGAAVLIP